MTWSLDKACETDIDELMTWFQDARSVDIWSGPKFRFPFDRESFHDDCRWKEFSSYCLRNSRNELAAFGQLGSRYTRSHLARLIVSPTMRRQGIGSVLLKLMIEAARIERGDAEVGLFVYMNNVPAYHCYLAMGFEVQTYPEDAPMPDQCFYLTKVLEKEQYESSVVKDMQRDRDV